MLTDMDTMFKTLQSLTVAYGCVGREKSICALLQEMVREYVPTADVRTDTLGNLIVRIGHPGTTRLLFDAHMDSIGFCVTQKYTEPILRFRALGFVFPQTLVGQTVVFENGCVGTIQSFVPSESVHTTEHLYIQLVEKKDLARICVGDTAVFHCPIWQEGASVCGAYLDNRAGCAALLTALKEMGNIACEVYAVFSVQEEVGMRGAPIAAAAIHPDYAFVIDLGPTGAPETQMNANIQLGNGIVNKVADDSIVCDTRAMKMICQAAQRVSVHMEYAVGGAGFTNAGKIHTVAGGIPTGIIDIPAQGLHTTREQVNLRDVLDCAKVICAIAASQA